VHSKYRKPKTVEPRNITFDRSNIAICLPLLRLTPPSERFPWDDLRKIFRWCHWMAKHQWRRKIAENFNRLSRVHERYRRQTDDKRQTTDGRATANVNVSREFALANKPSLIITSNQNNVTKGLIAAAHGWFNRIRQLAPIRTSSAFAPYRFCTSLSRFECIDRGHARASSVCHVVFLIKMNFLIMCWFNRVKMRYCTKFHSHSVKRCWVMTI